MHFLISNPVAFINAATPLESTIIVFCATTFGVVTIVLILGYIFLRPLAHPDPLAAIRNIFERSEELFVVCISAVGAYLLSVVLKNTFAIARPFVQNPNLHPLIVETGYSFPSSHATTFMALAAALFFINRRAGIVVGIGAVIIGIARILAGVHTPLDIIGGYVLGGLFAFAVFHIASSISRKAPERA